MKSNFLAVCGVILFAGCTFHKATPSDSEVQSAKFERQAISLAGKTYSRMVPSGGIFGQPAGSFKHTIHFIDGVNLEDNANSAFGNPPASYSYRLEGNVVLIKLSASAKEKYRLSKDLKTLTGEAGAVLKLEEDSADDGLTTEPLKAEAVQAMIRIFDRVHIPVQSNTPDCSEESAVIRSVTTSFNPSSWTIQSVGVDEKLNQAEISSMIALFDSLPLQLSVSGITATQEVTVKSQACNLNPAAWTVSYKKRQ